jgi:hypothetical protein
MAPLNLTILLLVSGCCFAQNLKHFDNSSVRVFYEECGQGPALYLLSGGPGEAPGRPYRQIIDSIKRFLHLYFSASTRRGKIQIYSH